MIPVAIQKDCECIVTTLKEKLSNDLIAAALFGSYARGDYQEGSDIDILLIARNLPDESVNTLAEDPANEDLLFVGTDLGVYVGTGVKDLGLREWHSLCLTLPTAPVVDLAVHARDGALVAATHGLGIFLLEIETIRAASGK